VASFSGKFARAAILSGMFPHLFIAQSQPQVSVRQFSGDGSTNNPKTGSRIESRPGSFGTSSDKCGGEGSLQKSETWTSKPAPGMVKKTQRNVNAPLGSQKSYLYIVSPLTGKGKKHDQWELLARMICCGCWDNPSFARHKCDSTGFRRKLSPVIR